jgi:hypothetical protein
MLFSFLSSAWSSSFVSSRRASVPAPAAPPLLWAGGDQPEPHVRGSLRLPGSPISSDHCTEIPGNKISGRRKKKTPGLTQRPGAFHFTCQRGVGDRGNRDARLACVRWGRGRGGSLAFLALQGLPYFRYAKEVTAIEQYWHAEDRPKPRKPPRNYKYIEELAHLQFELIKLQEWVRLRGPQGGRHLRGPGAREVQSNASSRA